MPALLTLWLRRRLAALGRRLVALDPDSIVVETRRGPGGRFVSQSVLTPAQTHLRQQDEATQEVDDRTLPLPFPEQRG